VPSSTAVILADLEKRLMKSHAICVVST
jgi:hypothetical protein